MLRFQKRMKSESLLRKSYITSLGDCNFNEATVIVLRQFFCGFNILMDGDADILQCFLFSRSLRPATRQTGARYAVSFFGMMEYDAIGSHRSYVTPAVNL